MATPRSLACRTARRGPTPRLGTELGRSKIASCMRGARDPGQDAADPGTGGQAWWRSRVRECTRIPPEAAGKAVWRGRAGKPPIRACPSPSGWMTPGRRRRSKARSQRQRPWPEGEEQAGAPRGGYSPASAAASSASRRLRSSISFAFLRCCSGERFESIMVMRRPAMRAGASTLLTSSRDSATRRITS